MSRYLIWLVVGRMIKAYGVTMMVVYGALWYSRNVSVSLVAASLGVVGAVLGTWLAYRGKRADEEHARLRAREVRLDHDFWMARWEAQMSRVEKRLAEEARRRQDVS